MSDLLEKIRSRGYWHIVVRPGSFIEDRVGSLATLEDIIERTSVRLRPSRWSFPHISSSISLHRDIDWISQEIELKPHMEIWRFYQSGQFIYFGGLVTDWANESKRQKEESLDESKGKLGVLDIALKYNEIFEFAARLSRTDAGDDITHIDVSLHGVKNHELWTADFPALNLTSEERKVSDKFYFKTDVVSASLFANSTELALKATIQTFKAFGWRQPNLLFLQDLQNGLIRH